MKKKKKKNRPAKKMGIDQPLGSLLQLLSAFYWETDARHRFPDRADSADCEIRGVYPDEASWQGQRETLEARRPFRDFEFPRLGPGGGEGDHFAGRGTGGRGA